MSVWISGPLPYLQIHLTRRTKLVVYVNLDRRETPSRNGIEYLSVKVNISFTTYYVLNINFTRTSSIYDIYTIRNLCKLYLIFNKKIFYRAVLYLLLP